MKVIVGLGNPGEEYARTRHNFGWIALDSLAGRIGASRFRREKGGMLAAEARVGSEKVYLLKPQSYMNRSGQALSSWLWMFKEVAEAVREGAEERPKNGRPGDAREAPCTWPGLMIVLDDVNLPLGKMRFRPSGEAGGHNGLKDLAKALGGPGYPRLRLGVGLPPDSMDRPDYVLDRFALAEMPLVEKVASAAAAGIEVWITEGIGEAMNVYNGVDLSG